jgi:hypothetical protein
MGLGMVMMGYIADYSSISATFIVSAVIVLSSLGMFRIVTLDYYERNVGRGS